MEIPLLTLILVILYLVILGFLSYQGYRGTKTAADYMVAGRKIHPFVMAMSYGATFISTSAIVGFGGAAALFGMGLLWLTFLNIFVGIFIAFIFLGGRTRAMGHHLNAHTFPEFLGKRFDSKFIQIFSGLVILLFMPLYTGVVCMGAAKVIEVNLGAPYPVALFFFCGIVALYVTMGGLKGVMYTDALQGSIMFVGMVLLLFLTYSKLGGIVSGHTRLTELAPEAVKIFGKAGHQGWTQMPVFGTTFWWILVSSIIMGVGIGVLAQPQLVVRYMTVRSTRELNRAILMGGIFILAMTGVAFVVGALSNVIFFEDTGKISFLAANKAVDNIIPLYITNYMPTWLGSVIVVTLLAAAMSTVSSQFHAMGTAAGRDIYEACSGTPTGDKKSIIATRVGIILTLVLSFSLAYILPIKFEKAGIAIIARGTAIFFGLCASAFLPMYVGALYTRAITKAGAIAGSMTGFLVSAFWLLFIHQKESEALQLCQKLFGKPSLVTHLVDGKYAAIITGKIVWPEVDPLFVAFPLAIIVTIVVSLVTKRYASAHLDNCFHGIER
ncbi:MAG: sodium:solute symporter family protein [Spartobacteria bacterium]|nr:sodium:solute symporter family protein [Spartobacteria bacterium]